MNSFTRRYLAIPTLCLLLAACNEASTQPDHDVAVPDMPTNPPPPAEDTTNPDIPNTPDTKSPPLTTECRPVDHPRDPLSEPMLLPCESTTEPCDNIDNDADGFTDPHCPTIACNTDAECTYEGLLPDADCNAHAQSLPGGILYPAGACNQIDGVPNNLDHTKCWGKLCPPTKKCVEGDCVTPGTGLPDSPCTGGQDCPLNGGCIPVDNRSTPSPGICLVFCHEFPCPEGFHCSTNEHNPKVIDENGKLHWSWLCKPGPERQPCPPGCDRCDPATGICDSKGGDGA